MKTEKPAIEVPTLKVNFQGLEYTLVKHPAYVAALKKGVMSLADFKFKPWTLRKEVNGAERKFKLSNVDKDAIRGALDILKGQRDKPAEFAAWLDERAARRGLTLGELAIKWKEAKVPDHNGRVRDDKAAARIIHDLDTALRWWTSVPVVSAENRFADFIAWRRANSKRGAGDRAADLELNALSCMCQWSVFAGLITVNPFRSQKYGGKRPTYCDKDKIEHCSDAMPESDEVVHRILTWFFTSRPAPARDNMDSEKYLAAMRRYATKDQTRIITGAWLAWNNLSGQRAGEPFYLARHQALVEEPHRPDLQPLGIVFPFGEHRVMKVYREKNGQNPYVVLHPALADFLQTWSTWLQQHLPKATVWFPSPYDLEKPLCPLRMKKGHLEPDTTRVNDLLAEACAELGVPHVTPSGFGRAYYTRVRKSQRISNAVIAEELGQTTLGKLIRTTYGRGDDFFGSRRYDWLPETPDHKAAPAAWRLLEGEAPANVVNLP